MEKEQKKKNSRIIWYIVYAILAVVLCYMFVVVYFFYISPYNISLKLTLWPFQSDESIGKMYLDATVNMDFTIKDNQTKEEISVSTVGVNVREDGVIIALYDMFRGCNDDTKITVSTNSGRMFNGKLLFGDINYNLAILKCENFEGQGGEIKIPYVKLASSAQLSHQEDMISVSYQKDNNDALVGYNWSGYIDTETTEIYKGITTGEGKEAVDFVMEECHIIYVNNKNYSGGAVLDKYGYLLGVSYGDPLQSESGVEEGYYCMMPVDGAKLFIDKALEAYGRKEKYQSDVVNGCVGFDLIDITYHMFLSETLAGNPTSFYFDETWKPYTKEIQTFNDNQMSGFFLLEDFVYDEKVVLEKNSVIINVTVNGRKNKIENKLDLFDVLYSVGNGDVVKFSYNVVSDTSNILENEFTV